MQFSTTSRRNFLRTTSCGFGSLALSAMLQQAVAASPAKRNAGAPLAVKPTHFPARAKRIIFLFMSGGPSQMDLFDHKPELEKRSGSDLPYKLPETEATVGLDNTKLLGSVSGFRHAGDCGLYMSDLLPHTAKHADDLCVLRAVHAGSPNHPVAIRQLHTGNLFDVVPSMGSWLSYGLGTENQQLPSYITILPQEGERNYSSAFLAAIHQGTAIQSVGSSPNKAPIRHLTDRSVSEDVQRRRIDLIQQMNRRQLERLETDQQMEGVIESFELAFKMQAETPKLVDFAEESKETQALYGIGEKQTDTFGRQCLLARRLSEAGVRFIQVSLGGWDHHNKISTGLPDRCAVSDKPVAGLLADLKTRGLLDDTLVLWGGEFGRTPHAQFGDGREHNHHGFTMWMAGGGVKGGITHGATDDFGYYGVEGQVHINDLHATMLHLMGLDHERLTFKHHGRPFRLTDVAGNVVKEILA
ncbi:MAG: DUF1501 domain-containing protein [Fuerstiella sp.]|jgi:hypothetical protein|nr:DUF1501 domain-containing protein [Fuerstiella sp.]MDG2127722.1 DUF1501 domain-containing protein [Fuerstiella sp.]